MRRCREGGDRGRVESAAQEDHILSRDAPFACLLEERTESLARLVHGQARGLEEQPRRPVALEVEFAVTGRLGERALDEALHALQCGRRVGRHSAVVEQLRHPQVRLLGELRRHDHLPCLTCDQEARLVAPIEHRPEPDMVTERPKRTPVRNDSGEGAAEPVHHPAAVRTEGRDHDVGISARDRRSACGAQFTVQLGCVVETARERSHQTTLGRDRLVDEVGARRDADQSVPDAAECDVRRRIRDRRERAPREHLIRRNGLTEHADHSGPMAADVALVTRCPCC